MNTGAKKIKLITDNRTDEQKQLAISVISALRKNRASQYTINEVAIAGSGKTYCMVTAVKDVIHNIPDTSILSLYFNKKNADEARGKFEGYPVTVKTTHALAMGWFNAISGKDSIIKKLKYRFPANVYQRLLNHSTGRAFSYWDVQRAMSLVDSFCKSDREEIDDSLLPVAIEGKTKEEVEYRNSITVKNAKTVWEMMNDANNKTAYITPNVYLKIFSLSAPQMGFDLILVDEAQDMNPCMLSFIKKQSNNPVVVFIGDDNQAINKWNGSVIASEYFSIDKELSLTQSFRSGQEIVGFSAKFLNHYLKPSKSFVFKGLDNGSEIGRIKMPDAILCRTNAMVLQMAITAIKNGLRPKTSNVKALIRIVRDAQTLFDGGKLTSGELVAFSNWEELERHATSNAGGDLRRIYDMVMGDTALTIINALEALSKGRRYDLDIVTAHSSKGLEWDSVLLAPDFKLDKVSKGEKDRVAEILPENPRSTAQPVPDTLRLETINLIYVALTRARKKIDISNIPFLTELLHS